jgi:hypothetical protein
MSDLPRPWIKDQNGHTWETDGNGKINVFALDAGYHNGPRCTSCGYSFCEHCQAGRPIEACPRPTPTTGPTEKEQR